MASSKGGRPRVWVGDGDAVLQIFLLHLKRFGPRRSELPVDYVKSSKQPVNVEKLEALMPLVSMA